ncbi:MAG: hypothetical protein A2275_04640 [Bacteroidetes bacterium RIFOXYA12_FULL_35_11]|nr:MAG: hypothetical protein A2X01_11160 [Bacteroidetes bacterium GWF2_35_48]OFY75455.1 MAG: hypothetical protein A2275_04640 [Bacteroidetes bacterium RIFOXYA12_FULL_35_11]OFY96118.1 MAG: hypothetical protein A2491_05880 [Bacteroidetes bacterium RIFOXYC12_FULL_35_7]HBX51320.1 hypothetical protein [Bacteroidales bacterium]
MNNNTLIKIIIVNNHPLFREGLKLVFRKANHIRLVAQTDTIEQALMFLKQQAVDLIITDLNASQVSTNDIIVTIKQEFPHIKILVQTSYSDSEILNRIINSKADGYIFKNAGKHELLAAIDKITAGGTYYCDALS